MNILSYIICMTDYYEFKRKVITQILLFHVRESKIKTEISFK